MRPVLVLGVRQRTASYLVQELAGHRWLPSSPADMADHVVLPRSKPERLVMDAAFAEAQSHIFEMLGT